MASSPKPPLPSAQANGEPSDGKDLRAWMVRYGPALRRYFLRRADAADVDDLVQEVFLNLQARGATTEIENVQGYLSGSTSARTSNPSGFGPLRTGSPEAAGASPPPFFA